jgi:hypothetical protein
MGFKGFVVKISKKICIYVFFNNVRKLSIICSTHNGIANYKLFAKRCEKSLEIF